MPTKKQIQPGEKVPLKLTAAERKLVLEDVTCLDTGYEQIIRDTPSGKPVMMTLDDLDDFSGYIAAAIWIGRVLQTQAAGLVQPAEIRNHALPRTTLGADGFDERPIGSTLTIHSAVMRPKKHDRVVRSENRSSTPVFSTTTRFASKRRNRRPSPNDLRPKPHPEKLSKSQISP